MTLFSRLQWKHAAAAALKGSMRTWRNICFALISLCCDSEGTNAFKSYWSPQQDGHICIYLDFFLTENPRSGELLSLASQRVKRKISGINCFNKPIYSIWARLFYRVTLLWTFYSVCEREKEWETNLVSHFYQRQICSRILVFKLYYVLNELRNLISPM